MAKVFHAKLNPMFELVMGFCRGLIQHLRSITSDSSTMRGRLHNSKTDIQCECTNGGGPLTLISMPLHTRLEWSLAMRPLKLTELVARQLNQLVVAIQVEPLIILGGPLSGRQDTGLGGEVELLGGILAADEALLVLLGAGLVVVDLVGVDLASDEILPVAMAVLDGLGHKLGVLVVAAHDLEDIVAASDLVVLGDWLGKVYGA